MFSFLFGQSKTRRPSKPIVRYKPRASFRPSFDTLEERVVMSTTRGTIVPGPIAPPTNPFAGARVVDLAKTPRLVISDSLNGSGDNDLFSLQLNAGDYLKANVQTASNLRLASLMSVYSESVGSTPLAQIGPSADPATGVMSTNPAYGFRASTPGTYFVRITSDLTQGGKAATTSYSVSSLATSGAYKLELHRLALATGQQDVTTLSATGKMYAWLDGSTLKITGPTGYGFGITDNWVPTTTTSGNLIKTTYTATGTASFVAAVATGMASIGLEMAPISVNSSFTITTNYSTFGQFVGEVNTINMNGTIATANFLANFNVSTPFGFDLNSLNQTVTVGTQIGNPFGLKLGNSAIVQNTGAPVNNAIPYIYFTVNPVNSPVTNVLSFVCDPADPALYINAGVYVPPIGPLTLKGIGFSKHGLIPYTPINQPTQYQGALGGNLVLQGSFDTTSLTYVPSEIEGDITMNFDPNHTGTVLGNTGVKAAAVAGLFALVGDYGASLGTALSNTNSPLAKEIQNVYKNFSVGINGTLKINPFAAIQPAVHSYLSWLFDGPSLFQSVMNLVNDNIIGNPDALKLLTVANGSLIYDGPTMSTYFRGGTVNAFEGTILAPLASPTTVDIEGAIKSGGRFFLDVKGNYDFYGMTVGGEVIIARNYPLTGRPAAVLAAAPQTSTANLTSQIDASLPTALSSTSGSTTLASQINTSLPVGVTPTNGSTNLAGQIDTSSQVAHLPTPYSGIYVTADFHMLGTNAKVEGWMLKNGDLFIHGTIEDHTLSILSGNVNIDISLTQANGFQFSGDWNAHFNWKNEVRGDLDVRFEFGIHNGHVTYGGSVTASAEVNTYLFGWQGASISAGISNGEIWIEIPGYDFHISLD